MQICLEQLLFKHGILPEKGKHRNSHVRQLACVSFVLYVRACTSLKKEFCSVLRVIAFISIRDATSHGLNFIFVHMQQILPALGCLWILI